MIHPSGTFKYEAEFTSEGFSNSDIVLHGTIANKVDGPRLVGHSPTIRFWNDRLVLVASEESTSRLRNASFAIGDAVTLSAHPGDQLHVIRTGSGGIGLSLLRDDRLVLAIGCVTAVPLGFNINVIKGPRSHKPFPDPLCDTRLEFQVESESLILRNRVLTQLGDCEIYVERSWQDGIPGVDECVSICRGDDPAVKIASVRSAILLGNSPLKMTRWDGSEKFI